MTLATEIAAARPEDTREVLERLSMLCKPEWYEPDADNRTVDDLKAVGKFAAMLDCGAFLSAAEMLVPEGCGVKLDRYWSASFKGPVWMAVLTFGGVPDDPLRFYEEWNAPTPALALAAAIAKSLEGREDR